MASIAGIHIGGSPLQAIEITPTNFDAHFSTLNGQGLFGSDPGEWSEVRLGRYEVEKEAIQTMINELLQKLESLSW